MRKSFTRFLSVLMLFCAFGLQATFAAAPSTFDGVNSVPKDNDANVKPADIATQFVLAFSDTPAITAAGGTLVIKKDGSIFKLVPITQTSADVQVVGKTLVVKHGITSFPEGSSYELILSTGITVGGNPAVIATGEEDFTIGDFTAPVLASANPLAPANGQMGVKANLTYPGGPDPFQIALTFNEPIAVGNGDVAIYNANGTVMDIVRVGTLGAPVTVVGNTATIGVNSNSYFAPESNYYVLVDAGSFVDVSPSANKFAGITTKTAWTFSTRVNNAPVITASVSNITAGAAKLNASINMAGKIWYKVQLSSDPDPSDYTGFIDGGTVTAGQVKTYDLTGLNDQSEYEVFIVSENAETPSNKSNADGKKVTFITLDGTAPIANFRGPVITDKKTSGVYIEFNEEVVGGTGNLSVRKASDNTLMFTVPASAVTSVKEGATDPHPGMWKVTLNFGGTLASLENYYVVFPVGYIKDKSGNSYGDDVPGLTVPVNYTDWPLIGADFEAPVVTYTTPTTLSGDVLVNFNENVVLTDGSPWTDLSTFANASKYIAFQKDGITVPATFSFASNIITINPDAALEANTEYTVILRPGVVKDASANANVLVAEQTKVFSTGDLDPIATTFGPSGSLSDYTPLTIKFNKAVRAIKTTGTPLYEALTNTNVKATVKLEKVVNAGAPTEVDPADYSATYDDATKTITVVPVNGKPFATSSATETIKYTLSIRPNMIEDNAGTDVEDVVPSTATNFQYTVSDYKKPIATLMSNEVVVGVTALTITFDEAVTTVTAGADAYPVLKVVDAQGNNIAFTTSWSGNVLSLTPALSELAVDKVLYYGIGASMKDAAGNVNAPVFKAVKIVGPAVPPTIHAVSYTVNGGVSTPIDQVLTGVTKDTNGKVVVKVTFDVNIDDKDLTTTPVTSTMQPGGNVTVASTDVSGKILTITLSPTTTEIPSSEQPATETVTIPVGLVEANEAYTNDPTPTFAQLAAPVTITVKTKDTQLPTVSAPWNGTTGVAVDATLKLVFSEPVNPVAGKAIKFTYGSTPTVAETVSITSANVVKDETVADGTVWVVKHVAFSQYSTLYTVVVAKDAFVDVADNNLGASDVSFTLTTVVNPAPYVVTYSPADEADLVGTSLDLSLVFSEAVEQASVTGSRKLVYVIEKVGTSADATINGAGDLVISGDDVQKYYAYVDDLSKVVVAGSTVTIKGVTLDAGKEYYVLITPGAFKDKSEPTTAAYAGITSYGATSADPWNFLTKDVYAPSVALSFNKLGADGLAAANSDVILTFSKLIVNYTGGTAITDNTLPSLVKLEKWNGSAWQNIAYTGHIIGENTIVIDNSSLVLLGEMKTDNQYRVSFPALTFKGKVSGTALDPYSEVFWTTDATAPTQPVVTFLTGSEVNDISYNTTDGDVVNLNIDVADINSGLTDHTAIKVYYLKSTTDLTMTGAEVKGLAESTEALAGDDDFNVTYKGSMTSKTTYYVYAVSEDVAGNLSPVTKFAFTTDDRVSPSLAAALPTTFTNDGKITLVFNEPVKPVAGAKARVIVNESGITYLADLANLTGGDPASLNEISIVGGPFTQMSNDVASYTVEIDPGMIVDVPRQVASVDVNAPNAWAGIVGTSFVVSSKDQVKPNLISGTPNGLVNLNQSFTLTFSEPVTLNNSFTQFVVLDGSSNPYDIVNASDISGLGTKEVVLTPKRALVSGASYSIAVSAINFSDLAGNVANAGSVTINYTGKDVVTLAAAFKADATTLPSSTELATVPTTLTIDLGEAFFLSDALDANVNTYDLQSHFYLSQDGTQVSFVATKVGNTVVLSDLSGSLGLGDAAKGKTYSFGFVDLYDASGNLNAGQQVSFTVKSDAAVIREVTFVPGDNDASATTKVNIAVDNSFKVEFNGLLYTYDISYPLNNLLMTVDYLKNNNVFTMAGVANLDIVSLDVVGGKHVVTLKPRDPLTSETVYTLNVNSSWGTPSGSKGIQIGQGTTGAIANYSETFITADVQAPKLIAAAGVTLPAAYVPVKVGVVGKDQMLALVFDEEVVGSGVVRIHRWDGVEVASIDITGFASEETAVGSGMWKLEIVKPVDLMEANTDLVTNQDYYIEVPAGSVVDVAASPNAFAGVTAVNEWKISLRDDTTPQVTFVDNTKTGVAVDTKIKLTFDRPVVMGKGWLAVYYEDGKAVDLIRTSAGGPAVTSYDFTLNQDLAENTKFYVELGEGTFDLAADNNIMQEQQNIGDWYFSTEVNAAPVAMEFVPEKADPRATGVSLSSGLSITFDMDVIPGTGNIQLHKIQNAGGPIITNFDVADPTKVTFEGNTMSISGDILKLENNSEYYVIVPATAIKNTSATPEFWGGVTVPFEWQFTTENDEVAPTAVYAPNGEEAVGLVPSEISMTLKFNENVIVNAGTVNVYDAKADTLVESLTVDASMLVDSTITVVPTALAEGMSYYVMVDAGLVKDLAGNEYEGVADKATWTFATGDFTSPVLTDKNPNQKTIEKNHPTLVMTFDEDVVLGEGSLKIYKKDGDALTLTIPVTESMISGNVVTVDYTTTEGLDQNTEYYVLVDANVVKDMADNAFAGLADKDAWTFTTGEGFVDKTDLKNASQFKVYPNPFVDFVNVENASKLSKIVVTNIAGQVVKEVVNPTSKIQLNELRSGIYFMSLYNTENVIEKTAKISKR